jgi:hypothetical protein
MVLDMASQRIDITTLELHESARELATEYIENFTNRLILQAQILAGKNGDNIVINTHVMAALDIIDKYGETRNHFNDICLALGGSLFGVFISGFISSLSTGDKVLIVIYMLMGFIGMILIMWNIRK